MARKLSEYNRFMSARTKGKMAGKTRAEREAIFRAAAHAWKGRTRRNPTEGGDRRAPARKNPRGGGGLLKTAAIGGAILWGLSKLSKPAAAAASPPASPNPTDPMGGTLTTPTATPPVTGLPSRTLPYPNGGTSGRFGW